MDKQIHITIEKCAGSRTAFRILVTGNTHPHKDFFRSLGMRWGNTAKQVSVLSTCQETVTGWYKYEEADKSAELIAKLQQLPNASIVESTEPFMDVYADYAHAFIYDFTEVYHANWNGKVYAAAIPCIYVDGNKVDISEEEAKLLKNRPYPVELLKKYSIKPREEALDEK